MAVRLNPEQKRLVKLAIAKTRGDSPRVRRSLLMAMGVEANYKNVNYGDRDSEGVLQQRPGQGWGPASESASTDMDQYLARARAADTRFRGNAGALAQKVQVSAFPDRYQAKKPEILQLIRQLGPSSVPSAGGAPGGGASGGARTVANPQLPALRQALARTLMARTQGGPEAPSILDVIGAARANKTAPATITRQVQQPQRRQRVAPSSGASQGPAGTSSGGLHGGLNEAFYDPEGGFDSGQEIPAIGGHGKHAHAAFNTPRAALSAIKLAKRMGLDVRENPYTENVDPVHTEGSFHYQNFPGRYGPEKKKLGRAIDVSGPPPKMAAFYKTLMRDYR